MHYISIAESPGTLTFNNNDVNTNTLPQSPSQTDGAETANKLRHLATTDACYRRQTDNSDM